jgi:hypothetical protein
MTYLVFLVSFSLVASTDKVVLAIFLLPYISLFNTIYHHRGSNNTSIISTSKRIKQSNRIKQKYR